MVTSKKTLKRHADEVEARAAAKARFIKALAQFLAGDQAKKSILLGMPNGVAFSVIKEWAELRNATPIFGYQTVDEAEAKLTNWMSDWL